MRDKGRMRSSTAYEFLTDSSLARPPQRPHGSAFYCSTRQVTIELPARDGHDVEFGVVIGD